ncbi:ABC transporter ATP-binding protein [Methylibium petroleiphilum]|uniref:ABC transporter ATP-binding protein n=1 Tax=Methylibium petroleiphilum TaxID=105560 RepID=UPI001ACC516C|nr:ABC transporter ATP-binding protein [Methylibium petroleiphilum]MBN9203927.1 ABC transporter ATP-binding protein [Methylibium petroleiphilum]
MSAAPADTLSIEALHVALDADAGLVRAIDGLSLAIARGETFALVGESGCGKSMTALALMRLLPENGRVTAGSVRLGGEELLDLPESRMRAVRGARVGMIFQEPATSLNPVMRIGAQIVEAIEAHTPLRGAAARAKALDWLRRVGIPEPERRIDDYPFRLSGGQKQRVMIAIALAAEPEFLVADEPTTALDVTIQKQILDLLRELQRERGLGLMLITHDLGVVAGMAQTVALMYAGQIVEVASAKDFFAHPRHPYARLLLRAVPDASQRGGELAAIAGSVPPLWRRFEGCRFADRCDRVFDRCHRTEPSLIETAAGHQVRCLLYVDGASPPGSAPATTAIDAPAVRLAPADPSPLLDVQNLVVRFPVRGGLLQRARSHVTAVDGVSFRLDAGRTLALVGESGCGKTTIGKALLQLLRGTAAVEGRALWRGEDLFSLQGDALRRARREIQIVFQDPFASLDPRMRVFEALEEGLVALRPELDRAARRARIETLVERVGLRRDALERWPHEFSGGQRQRIAIARALAVEPRLLVCDEPTSALDVSVQAQILNLLRELQRELGVSYLFITHNIGVVEYIADEVAVMHRGRFEEVGPVGGVLEAPRSAYTRRLLAAVPRLDRQMFQSPQFDPP